MVHGLFGDRTSLAQSFQTYIINPPYEFCVHSTISCRLNAWLRMESRKIPEKWFSIRENSMRHSFLQLLHHHTHTHISTRQLGIRGKDARLFSRLSNVNEMRAGSRLLRSLHSPAAIPLMNFNLFFGRWNGIISTKKIVCCREFRISIRTWSTAIEVLESRYAVYYTISASNERRRYKESWTQNQYDAIHVVFSSG